MTMQSMDKIFFQGEEYWLAEEPLRTVKPRPRFMAVSTANHRGYTAVFSIVGSRLFLVAASGHLEDGSGGGDALLHFFPGATEPIHVRWYSGPLRLFSGRQIPGPELEPAFENEIGLDIDRGEVAAVHPKGHPLAPSRS